MKKIVIISLIYLSMVYVVEAQSTTITFNLEQQQQSKMKLLIGVIKPNDALKKLADRIKENLSCTQQTLSGFAVFVESFEKNPTKNALKKYAQEGFPLIIFIQEKMFGYGFEWRIYDALQASMNMGKSISWHNKEIDAVADFVSDTLWQVLTGQEGIFSTKIAYCVETNANGHHGSDIYYKKPLSEQAELLVKGGKLLAPRWNKDAENPLLLYSEVTPSNIRLMATTMQHKRRLVSNFDGLTMLPSFSSDGQKVVYCASYKGTTQLYSCSVDLEKKRKISQRLTHNAGNNTSPTLRDNGDIIFCSDFETRVPQLYYLHASDGKLERLTQGGYCASPHFSEKNGKIVYCKLVGNTMQIFVYDLTTKQHIQLTKNQGNKDECCWSPCGNYVVFSIDTGKTSRIALLNCITNEQIFITDEHQRCSYPTWSSKFSL